MSTGLIRNLKFQFKISSEILLEIVITIVGLLLYTVISSPISQIPEVLSEMTPFFSVIAVLLFSSAFFLSMHQHYLPIAISFGSTRRDSFLVLQIFKIFYAILPLIPIFLLDLFVDGFSNTVYLQIFFLFACVLSWVEFMSVLSKCFGKWGIIIFSFGCAIIGGIVGFTISYINIDTMNFIYQLAELVGTLSILVIVVSIVVNALCIIGSWFLYKKSSV